MKKNIIIAIIALLLLFPTHAGAERKKVVRKLANLASSCSACSIVNPELESLYKQDITGALDTKLTLPEEAWEAYLAEIVMTKCNSSDWVEVLWGAIMYGVFMEHFRDKISCAKSEYIVTKAKNSMTAVAGMGGGEACLQKMKDMKHLFKSDLDSEGRRKADNMYICFNNCLIPMGVNLYRTHRATRSCR